MEFNCYAIEMHSDRVHQEEYNRRISMSCIILNYLV